jgi:hypothetical protein
MQWFQDPTEIIWDNLSYIRRESRRILRNKVREYLKGKINELSMKSKNKNNRGLYR